MPGIDPRDPATRGHLGDSLNLRPRRAVGEAERRKRDRSFRNSQLWPRFDKKIVKENRRVQRTPNPEPQHQNPAPRTPNPEPHRSPSMTSRKSSCAPRRSLLPRRFRSRRSSSSFRSISAPSSGRFWPASPRRISPTHWSDAPSSSWRTSQPAKLMGIESNGMVLAASSESGQPVLLTVDAEPGWQVR